MTNLPGDAPCLYFTAANTGILLEANESLCTHVGYTKDELEGKNIEIIFTVSTRIFCQTHLFPLLAVQGYANEIFITLHTKSKVHLPVLINAKRTVANNKTVDAFVGMIVHNRKKFEDELVKARTAAEDALLQNSALQTAQQQLQKQLEETDRNLVLIKQQNDELRQFNHVVTHDLEEPLRKLSLFANMLNDDTTGKINATPKQIIAKLLQVSNKMRTIINGLQQYAWLSEAVLELSELDVNTLLKKVQEKLEKDFPGEELIMNVEPVLKIQADAGQMFIFFYEVLSNAIKFRKQHQDATVHVSAAIIHDNQFRSIPDKYKFEKYIKIELRDEGVGFDPDYKSIIFELFKRLHLESGYGIGLSLAKKVINNHGGVVSADSSPNEGTIISIQLPWIDLLTN